MDFHLLAKEVVANLAKNFRGAGLLLKHLNKRFKFEAFLKMRVSVDII